MSESEVSRNTSPELVERRKRAQQRFDDSRRPGGRPLERDTLNVLNEAGVRDFSRTSLWANTVIRNWKGGKTKPYDFRGAKLNGARFDTSDLRGASFVGADMSRVKFVDSFVSGADFSTIVIQDRRMDLRKRQIFLSEDLPVREVFGRFRGCPDAERRYNAIFSRDVIEDGANHEGKGIVLKKNGVVIGGMKTFEERSFLATRTICNTNGEVIFWEGGLYELDTKVKDMLLSCLQKKWEKESKHIDRWPVIDVDNLLDVHRETAGESYVLGINFIRFLQDTRLYMKFPEWTKVLEGSTNNMHIDSRSSV